MRDLATTGTALVTGAATGIGLATAQALVSADWKVLGTAMPGQETAELESAGATVISVDLTVESDRERLFRTVGEEPRLDALISNAGMAAPGPLEALPDDSIRVQIELNSIVPALLAKAVLPALRQSRGRMVFIGAGQGRVALPFGGPYGASKAALALLTDALRAEVASSGVSVSLIEPGAVRTGIMTESKARGRQLLEDLPPDIAARYSRGMTATIEQAERAFATALAPDDLAKQVVRILSARKPKPRYLIGREAVGLAILAQLPARLRARVVARLAKS
ncbi:SDR family NAD(P)-dependent oxidoreductase [Saccharomonospora sp. NPDC006951]